MRALSQGELDKIPEARESFRKLLEQYPQLVQVQLDGTTLYATRPQTGASPVIPTLPASALASPKATSTANAQASPKSAPPPAKTARAERKLSEPEVRQLLIQALSEMEQGKKHVRAGLLKERLYALSNQTFDETQYNVPHFRAFLEKFPDLVQLEQQGTTLFVSRVLDEEEAAAELHVRYRHALKKRGLRVVPAQIRLQVLKDVITILQSKGSVLWKTMVDDIVDNHQGDETASVSKGHVHDTLRVARRAEIISTTNGSKSLTADPLELIFTSNKLFQDAVMRCDATYLQELEEAFGIVDLNEAAMALYDSKGHERYLKVVQNHFKANGQA